MKLRKCRKDELESLVKFLRSSEVYYAPIDKIKILEKKLEHDPESIIVAVDKGKIIGTVFVIYDPWNSFIYHLAVRPSFRGKGMGNKLMDEAEKLLLSRGMKCPTLFVEEENKKVLEFYKKRGWHILYKTYCLEKAL